MGGFVLALFLAVSSVMVFFDVSSAEELTTGEKIDTEIWGKIDAECLNISEHEPPASSKDTLFLRIVEYTTFGMRSYSMYPDAAKAVMQSTHFDPKRRTVIFAHGFTDNPGAISGESFAMAYKIHGGYNVLALDSSKLIHMLYARSSVMVKYIGEAFGVFLHNLVKEGVKVDSIHLVGHSLGAHICGFAGKAFQILNSDTKLPRITGMDPAGPCFVHRGPDEKLDKRDADFVDIIHTNIGIYGINQTIGDVDFFPNGGGIRQPGCVESACSHNRVWMLFEESVNFENNFIAVRCNSVDDFNAGKCSNNEKSVMGYATPDTTRGTYYLRTGSIPMFGLGDAGASP